MTDTSTSEHSAIVYDDAAEAVMAGLPPRTRVLFLSHITSPTAATCPWRS